MCVPSSEQGAMCFSIFTLTLGHPLSYGSKYISHFPASQMFIFFPALLSHLQICPCGYLEGITNNRAKPSSRLMLFILPHGVFLSHPVLGVGQQTPRWLKIKIQELSLVFWPSHPQQSITNSCLF